MACFWIVVALVYVRGRTKPPGVVLALHEHVPFVGDKSDVLYFLMAVALAGPWAHKSVPKRSCSDAVAAAVVALVDSGELSRDVGSTRLPLRVHSGIRMAV